MAHGQSLPPLAEEYHRRQQLTILAASQASSRVWSRMVPGDLDTSWRTVGPMLVAVISRGQRDVSRRAAGFIPGVLRATGQPADPFGQVTPLSLVGSTGDGRTVLGLVTLAPIQVKQAIARGATVREALDAAEGWLRVATETTVADTARQAEVLQSSVYPVDGYVRMVNAGACSRCAILAGRWYRKNQGFLRHERCRCVHIPASEAVADDWRLNPQTYFDSLTPEQQDRVFTKAGAEAIRAGADPVRVVNARRGMSTAQQNTRGWIPKGRLVRQDVYGQQVFTTTEGVTRRGSASRARTGRRGTVRLMPESIVEMAGDNRAELVRLLRLHGYMP